MKILLKLEELALFIFGIYLFSLLNFDWWLFPLLLLVPDLSMVGYLVNPIVGAFIYNTFHNRVAAIFIYLCGYVLTNQYLLLVGVILFAHIAMDRMLGFGLKYKQGFKFTHLTETS